MGEKMTTKSAEEQSIEYLKKKQNEVIDNIAEWQMYRFAIEALEEKIACAARQDDEILAKPEKPFLLMFKDVVGRDVYEWFDDEEKFEMRVKEVKSNPYPCTEIEAIKIGGCRKIKIDEI